MRAHRAFLALVSVVLFSSPVLAADAAAITDGSVVSLDVKVFDLAGKEVHATKAGEPLVYTHGTSQIFPKLEQGVGGLKVGDEKDVTLEPADAFGVSDPKRVSEVPKDKVPAEALKVGTVLGANGPDGNPHPVTVKEIKDQTVMIDTNHPLAGQKLRFHVKVAKVEPGKPGAKPDSKKEEKK